METSDKTHGCHGVFVKYGGPSELPLELQGREHLSSFRGVASVWTHFAAVLHAGGGVREYGTWCMAMVGAGGSMMHGNSGVCFDYY